MADKASLLGKRKAEDGSETEPVPRRHKEKETRNGLAAGPLQGTAGELSETKSDDSNLISEKEFSKILFVANLSPQTETSDIIDFFKDVGQVVRVRLQLSARGKHEAAVPIKTLFIASFSRHSTEISDIIDFFKDVGQVVRVRLDICHRGKLVGCGYVEFASANQANKALQNKNGEYLHDRKIFLADCSGASFLPPKYEEEEDYLQEESLPLDSIQHVAAMEEGPDETPHSANEEVLLIANLSPQTTKTEQIIRFFEDVGRVVSVRLIVDPECKHMGYGIVEFTSSYEAETALKEMNGEFLHDHKILLMRGLDETPDSLEEAATVRNKTLFVARLSPQTKISDIIDFFKDVGEVVHVRLIVDPRGKLTGEGFVEFASANEAMKALEKKNGEYLNSSDVFLAVFETPPYHRRPKYQDYLQRESLEIKEDVAAVEKGLDETPHFTEETVRKRTVFVDELSYNISISDIINFFKDVREEIIRVRLIVDGRGDHVGCCFVEMAKRSMIQRTCRRSQASA
ncbi:hypothetical protein Bca52824_022607 [Brassica carinata]|uniref:RRM domain-containing protein n=1 Tax=Brassica carinata TaxID=52824 RepID=A0A8X8ARZ2_BRACI|nr:hypothetical protein Bca52824_022607 [Brassica carinata]